MDKTVKYSVPPWSRVRPGTRRGNDPEGCAICGRPVVVTDDTAFAVVVDGGAAWGDDDSDQSAPGYMGGFPVGPDCHKRFAVKPAPGAS